MKKILYIMSAVLVVSCQQVNDNQAPSAAGEWLIPVNEVFDGGPGQDGIPALTNPEESSVGASDFMLDDDLIIGVKFGGEVRGYPHKILDWHEIINDQIGINKYAVTYCPLTGSALGWSRILNGKETTFGVSGLLYNTNLIPYDRLTGSRWSQMLNKCVNGDLSGSIPGNIQIIETNWKTFSQMFPNAKVVNTGTGYNRTYGVYPYGDYKINNTKLLFPINPTDNRLPWKTRILGVRKGSFARAYKLDGKTAGTVLVQDSLANESIVIVRNDESRFGAAFISKIGSKEIGKFIVVQDSLPVIMRDTLGNRYNVFGEVTRGPDKGKKLSRIDSFVAYWVAWAGFYPSTGIYED